jgi:hypothetical protein
MTCECARNWKRERLTIFFRSHNCSTKRLSAFLQPTIAFPQSTAPSNIFRNHSSINRPEENHFFFLYSLSTVAYQHFALFYISILLG